MGYAIKRYNTSLSTALAPGGGQKPGPVDRKLAAKVKRSFKNYPGLSDRDRVMKCKTSRLFINPMHSREGLKSFKAIKYPNRTDKQN